MNIIELLAIGIRLTGFYALIQAAQYLMGTAQVAFELDGEFRDDYERRMISFIAITAFWCLVALLSLKLPMAIARKMLTVGITLKGSLFFYHSFPTSSTTAFCWLRTTRWYHQTRGLAETSGGTKPHQQLS